MATTEGWEHTVCFEERWLRLEALRNGRTKERAALGRPEPLFMLVERRKARGLGEENQNGSLGKVPR